MKKGINAKIITVCILAFMTFCTVIFTAIVLLRIPESNSADTFFSDFLYCCTIGISYFGFFLLGICDYSIGEFNSGCVTGILIILSVICLYIFLIINLIRKNSNIINAIIIALSSIGILLSIGLLADNILLGLFYVLLRVAIIFFCVKNIKSNWDF